MTLRMKGSECANGAIFCPHVLFGLSSSLALKKTQAKVRCLIFISCLRPAEAQWEWQCSSVLVKSTVSLVCMHVVIEATTCAEVPGLLKTCLVIVSVSF